jgi:hypothetical protein
MLVAKTYPLLLQAVEEGALLAVNRVHKIYDSDTSTEVAAGVIADCVMETILEAFDIMDATES